MEDMATYRPVKDTILLSKVPVRRNLVAAHSVLTTAVVFAGIKAVAALAQAQTLKLVLRLVVLTLETIKTLLIFSKEKLTNFITQLPVHVKKSLADLRQQLVCVEIYQITPPTDEVQKCETTDCNIFGIESHQSKTIYWGKEDGDYYLTERNCEKKKNSQLITELCPSTSNPSVSTDPENPEVSTPPANNECGSGIWIDNNGIEHDERKVPCTFSGCGEEDCENYQVKVTAGGSACCFQSAIGKCVPSSSCSSISYFTYPQEVVQEALSGIQTTIDGQQIDCDTNQCIPL
jgi:hypothetical protein